MEVATDTRQLFEVLQPTETNLDGFKVTLAFGGCDTVLTAIKPRRNIDSIFIITFNKFR
jgi:hypothetical protein